MDSPSILQTINEVVTTTILQSPDFALIQNLVSFSQDALSSDSIPSLESHLTSFLSHLIALNMRTLSSKTICVLCRLFILHRKYSQAQSVLHLSHHFSPPLQGLDLDLSSCLLQCRYAPKEAYIDFKKLCHFHRDRIEKNETLKAFLVDLGILFEQLTGSLARTKDVISSLCNKELYGDFLLALNEEDGTRKLREILKEKEDDFVREGTMVLAEKLAETRVAALLSRLGQVYERIELEALQQELPVEKGELLQGLNECGYEVKDGFVSLAKEKREVGCEREMENLNEVLVQLKKARREAMIVKNRRIEKQNEKEKEERGEEDSEYDEGDEMNFEGEIESDDELTESEFY